MILTITVRLIMKCIHFLIFLGILNNTEAAKIELDGIKPECYVSQGDVHIGYLVRIRKKGIDGFCSEEFQDFQRPQNVEAMVYTVNEINNRHDLLPNITLGFVIFDECSWDLGALSKSLYFLPIEGQESEPQNSNCSEGLQHYEVVGVLGPTSSRMSVLVGSLLSIFHIPILSPSATSDELSDKSRFKYFLRLLPPDRFMTYAILDLFLYYQWMYASFLYSEGSYGESAAKHIESGAKERDICFALSIKVLSTSVKADYDNIVKLLIQNDKARVVILFLEHEAFSGLFSAVFRANKNGYFVWLGSDYMSFNDLGPGAEGAFYADHYLGDSVDFGNHYKFLTPRDTMPDPWMKVVWEDRFDCSWSDSEDLNSCYDFIDVSDYTQEIYPWAFKTIDGTYAFAYALHQLISDECPHAFMDKNVLDSCIQGEHVLKYLKNVSFDGITGHIKFDDKGDIIGRYVIRQFHHDGNKHDTVGIWDKSSETWTMDTKFIDWTVFYRNMSGTAKEVNTTNRKHPESICSKPCGPKEYYLRKELWCCWECKTCRPYEIIDNSTGCISCPFAKWPDNQTQSKCEHIAPIFLLWSDPIAVSLIVLTLGCAICAFVIGGLFRRNYKERLIKASSRELMSIIFLGILTAYGSVFAFVARPSIYSCVISRFGFNMAVSLIFCPLLVKTHRIYRIFTSGKMGNHKVSMISTRSMVIFSVTLVTVQVMP